MKRKLIWLFLCLLNASSIISCNMAKYGINYTKIEEPRYAALNGLHPLPENKNSLKVVSYNIEFAKRIDKAIDLLANHPDLKDADIILLQEMDDAGVDRIARTLQYNYIYYPAVFHPIPKQNFGNAVLSKWPIIQDEKVILQEENSRKLQRVAANALIQFHDKKIMVSSIHMRIKLQPFVRGRQIRHVLKSMPKNVDYNIIAGDFNTFHPLSLHEILEEFLKKDYTFVTKNIGWTHRSWYTFLKRSTTDHIFSKGLIVQNRGKVTKAKASDHLPIWAEFSFK